MSTTAAGTVIMLRRFGRYAAMALGLWMAVQSGKATAAEVPLSLESGESVSVSRVVISNGRGSLAVAVADGQVRRLQNSPQLTGVPTLRDLAASEYPAAALRPDTRIGAAWHDGDALFVVLDEPLVRLETIESVTLFNERWSYRLLGRVQAYSLDMAQDLPGLGSVPTVQRWLRLLPEPDDVRLLTFGTRRSPLTLLSAGASAREDVETLNNFYAGDVHRLQEQLGIVVYPSESAD